jgi:transcriptional regulator with XRE-family HTH domain
MPKSGGAFAYDLIVRRLDPPALYAALDSERARRGLTWNQVAAEAGVNIGTIRRLRGNGRFETDGIQSLTQWLGRPVEEFTRQSNL